MKVSFEHTLDQHYQACKLSISMEINVMDIVKKSSLVRNALFARFACYGGREMSSVAAASRSIGVWIKYTCLDFVCNLRAQWFSSGTTAVILMSQCFGAGEVVHVQRKQPCSPGFVSTLSANGRVKSICFKQDQQGLPGCFGA